MTSQSADPGDGTGPVPPPAPSGLVVLAPLAVAWLAVTLWAVRVSLRAPADGVLGITEAAYGLPSVISAALAAGAAVALVALRGAVRPIGGRPLPRFGVGLAGGLLTGAVTATAVVLGYGFGGSAITILGWTLVAGATVGGALAGIHRTAGLLVGASVAAALAVFGLTLLREVVKGELLDIFGAGDTPASVLAAQTRLTWFAALLAGLLAGAVAFGHLRWTLRRAGAVLPWPGYLMAGAGAGLLMVITEVITRIGGAELLELARSFSESDDALQTMANAARINSGLIVFFVGALTALICLGRTLPAPAATARTATDRRTDPI